MEVLETGKKLGICIGGGEGSRNYIRPYFRIKRFSADRRPEYHSKKLPPVSKEAGGGILFLLKYCNFHNNNW